MTVPATTRRAGPFTGNGAASSFPFDFKVFSTADIAVVQAADGIETTLALGTDYTVTLNADQDVSPGGTVNTTAPLPVGETLAIVGAIDYDQQLDLPAGGAFRPLALENALDRTVIQIQQLREEVERTLRLPVTSDSDLELPLPESNKLLGWNDTATALQNFDASTLAASAVYADWRYNTFTGNGSATQFALDAAPGALGNLDVSIDGVTQVPGVDYTLTGAVLTFTSAPANGTQILARYGSAALQDATGYIPESFVASAGQAVFNLVTEYTPGANNLQVFVDGILMHPGDYSETSATSITFATPLAGGEDVLVVIGRAIATSVDAANVGYSAPSGQGMSAKSRFDRVTHVTDFPGVDPTGTSDSTAGFQAAVNFLESQLTTSNYGNRGAALFIPDGEYLIRGTVEIGKTGITGVGLFGNPSKGARLFTDQSSQTMFTVGDSTGAENVYEVHFSNLFFAATSLNNTGVVAIRGYNSFIVGVRNCVFRGFYESIVSERGNRWWVTGCRFWQSRTSAAANSSIRMYGNSGGDGGGWHILDNEFSGGGSLEPSVTSHLLYEGVDSSYVVNNHFRDCAQAIETRPAGTTGKNSITSLWVSNNYFDVNYGSNVLIGGTINWSAGSTPRYHHLHFNSNYFRGGLPGNGTHCVKISVTQSGTPDLAADEGLKAISFTGGSMCQAESTALLVEGSSAGKAEVYGLVINGVTFADNNEGGAAATSAIKAEAESIVIDGCQFNRDDDPATQCVEINLSASESNTPSAIIANNNFRLSNCTGTPWVVTQPESGGSVVLRGNIGNGRGKDIDQSYRVRTSNATPNTVFSYEIPDKSAGWFEVYVTGISTDGTKTVTRAWRTAFARNTTSSLSSGTTSGTEIAAWNPGAFGTLPTCTLSTNTLEVTVTGIAATTVDWDVHVVIYGSR